MGYFPKIWKMAVVKVIPKPNKDDYSLPKSYRPIGLLPIFGKVLEKLFANRLLWQLGNEGALSSRQFGFMPQRSTEDALHVAVEKIRTSVKNKGLAVVVSLDVEGAFDNAWWPAILHQLIRKKVSPSLINLVHSYLQDRRVTLRYAGAETTRETNKGCIQGSTCGPLLWNIMLDGLLEISSHLHVHIQAFADDILLIGTGREGASVEDGLNSALNIISRWGKSNKLKFAPHKTQVIKITKKLKYHTPELSMDGTPLLYSEDLKVLGLTIDENLNFLKHVQRSAIKANNLYRLVSRAARANWGLNQEIRRTIYAAVVEPTMLYAANVWASKSHSVQIRRKLDQVTRIFGIMVSRAHKTISLTSSTILAGILPLDLRANEQRSLYKVKRGEPFAHLPGRELEAPIHPFDLPHPSHRRKINFGFINNEDELESLAGDGLFIFTDGSKIEGKVGAAACMLSSGREVGKITLRLASYCSVFQAELLALKTAICKSAKRKDTTKIKVFCDSRSALDCLADPNCTHKLAHEAKTFIKEIEDNGRQITFYWVRAHNDIAGNERADALAKQAALQNKRAIDYDRFPLSFAKRLIREETIRTWQGRYAASTTGATTKLFFPDVKEAYHTLKNIQMDNVKSQLFTGHGGLKQYLCRFKLVQDPCCVCDDSTEETISHLLINCPRFSPERLDCEHRMNLEIKEANFSKAVNDKNCRDHFLDFAIKALKRAAKANGSTLT